MSHILIETQSEFEDLIERCRASSRYALDTEFHREKTYFPKLALMQIAVDGAVYLVDPTRVEVKSFASVLDSETTVVMHAAQQDIEVLYRSTGCKPKNVLDTQLVAGFVGYSTPSLSNLVQAMLGVSLPKGDRLTDWFARPLSDEQMKYAASDVDHLLDLLDGLEAELQSIGRMAWAREACAELTARSYEPIDPRDAWLRLKDVRTLSGQARAVAQEIATWREKRAQRDDLPPRIVLSDLGVLTVAQRRPQKLEDLAGVRGVDPRVLKGKIGQELLEVVQSAPSQPIPFPAGDSDDGDRRLKPAITLATAWVSELARRERLDPSLLATKSDVVAFLRGKVDSRLATGWRNEILGSDLRDLLDGRAALSFDSRGHMRFLRLDPQ